MMQRVQRVQRAVGGNLVLPTPSLTAAAVAAVTWPSSSSRGQRSASWRGFVLATNRAHRAQFLSDHDCSGVTMPVKLGDNQRAHDINPAKPSVGRGLVLAVPAVRTGHNTLRLCVILTFPTQRSG